MKLAKKPRTTVPAKEPPQRPKDIIEPANQPSPVPNLPGQSGEGPTKSAQETEVKAERSEPSPFEVATLATLMAINDSIQHPDVKKEPETFLPTAFTLLKQAERLLGLHAMVEMVNKFARIYSPPEDLVIGELSWQDVLVVQKDVPKQDSCLNGIVMGTSAVKRGTRIRTENTFGPLFFHYEDLVHRPPGVSMVGCIGTEKGLRIAIKRIFDSEQASQITDRKRLTLGQINVLLFDQLKRYGHIPKVRASKANIA
jgi:hypothetical protein